MPWYDRFFARSRRRKEPQRESIPYARSINFSFLDGNGKGKNKNPRIMPKPTSANLRRFSRTPYARRAINAIKNPIAGLDWEIVPVKDAKASSRQLDAQIKVLTDCFERPNNEDSFGTLITQALEDYLVVSAGAIEQQVGNDPARPLWMWPVDGQTIQVYGGWDGSASQARYLQTIGFAGVGIQQGTPLRNDELVYIRPNMTAADPFGYGPIEIAFRSITHLLGARKYSGNVASNATPNYLLWLQGQSQEKIDIFRNYWIDQIEGQGEVPIVGGDMEPKAVNLHSGNDEALYLKWQDVLIREIAAAFDISPQNMGLEADVNRNTSETAEDRDWDQAIIPTAKHFAGHFTRETIQGRCGCPLLQFKFVGLERQDETAEADRFQIYYRSNAMTPNEQRQKLGLPPLKSQFADLSYADMQIAVAAARGSKVIEDDAFPKQEPAPGTSPAPADPLNQPKGQK